MAGRVNMEPPTRSRLPVAMLINWIKPLAKGAEALGAYAHCAHNRPLPVSGLVPVPGGVWSRPQFP